MLNFFYLVISQFYDPKRHLYSVSQNRGNANSTNSTILIVWHSSNSNGEILYTLKTRNIFQCKPETSN